MKILVVTPHYYPENFSITSICEGFVKNGHEVFVVTDQPNYGLDQIMPGYENVFDETINGVKVHRVKIYPRKETRISIIKNYLSFWKNSKKYIREIKEEYDVVYSMSLSPIIAVSGANIYAKKHQVRHILHCLDLWPESTVITKAIKQDSLLYKILFKWSVSIYRKADEILVSSPSFKEYFEKVLKLPIENITYVPQPAFMVSQTEKPQLFEKKFNFVYAGNIGSIQLVENIVKGFSEVPFDATLHLIGMGSKSESVKKIIADMHLEDKVIFYGPKPRNLTASYYENSTGIIVSLKEGGFVGKTIPNKLISSLDFGKPILACINGDGRSILNEANGSVFTKGENPSDFAEAFINLCILSDEERKNLGDNNKKYYSEHFRFDEILNEIISHLEEKEN